MMTPLEQSFRAKLRQISQERRVDLPTLWQNLVLERFLVRVSLSRFASKFILKGGVLLSSYEPINRRTKDLDFLVQKIQNNPETLFGVISEIIAIPLDDGFEFTDLEVAALPHPHMKYAGVRAKMRSTFGKGRFKISVDLGYGDLVEPIPCSIPLISGPKGALFESSVAIDCYPREFIFAEKLESIIRYGGDNSRMKDFHDLQVLIRSEHLSSERLNVIVPKVFEHRFTPLDLPITILEDDMAVLQKSWRAHLRGLPAENSMPEELKDIVSSINAWLFEKTSLCGLAT